MSLHPEVEKLIEAGPTAEEWEHWGEHGNFVPFASRIALRAVEKEREAMRDAFIDALIETDATWSVGEARNVAEEAIRRRKGEAVSNKPIHEVIAEISAKVPADEWAKLGKTHYADPDTLATLNRLEHENAALRAELERVRKDAERWRYRINYEYEISCSSTAISREEWIASRTAAIDAARKEAERG